MQSLADFLGNPAPAAQREEPVAYDKLTPKEFCQAILASSEFRSYLLNGITLGDLPAAVIVRVMDIAWGKPVDRVEHTGKDGRPIEALTEVRMVLVRANAEQHPEAAEETYTTH